MSRIKTIIIPLSGDGTKSNASLRFETMHSHIQTRKSMMEIANLIRINSTRLARFMPIRLQQSSFLRPQLKSNIRELIAI